MVDKSIESFIDVLSSAAPVPGGGGASALVGAVGMALGSMVGNLTSGKKKYADVQADIETILAKAKEIQQDLLALIQKDAEVFEPLSKAYGLPKETEEEKAEKARVLEAALKTASAVPFAIMEKIMEAITLHEELKEKGTRIAISDVGVGVIFCKAALQGASLNVFINTQLMKDREYAEELNKKTQALLDKGLVHADKIYNEVEAKLR